MQFDESALLGGIAGYCWTLIRVGSLFVAFPLFAGHTVPQRVRLMLAAAVTWVILPGLPPMPQVELFSLPGFLIGAQQFLIGMAMGLVLHMVFAAVMIGGQSAAYGTGLGFASLVDPVTGVQVPVLSHFYQLLTILLFFGMDAHLLLIRLLAESFQTLPVGVAGLSREALWNLSTWIGRVFAAGMLMSLPVVAALLLVNLGFGIAGRASPQLNIFSVGFPVGLLLGLWLVGISLPDVLVLFAGFLDEGYGLIGKMIR